MPSPNHLTTSVVIPVYRDSSSLRACLNSLSDTDPPPFEVIVVADGDPGDLQQLTEPLGARFLRSSVRGGPAKARNLGAGAAGGDILLFIDSDVTVPSDIIGMVESVLRLEPELAAVFGSYDDQPAYEDFISQYKNLFHHYVHQTSREDAGTFWSACGAIRSDIFRKLGGFNEKYRRPSIEDIELGYRLKRSGYNIRLCKALQVEHLKRWGFASMIWTDFFKRAVPWSDLIIRHRMFINDLNLKTTSRMSVVFVYGLLVTLIGAFWWPGCLVLAGACAIALISFNAGLYRFFGRKRGWLFSLRAVPLHWFYLFYCGLGFAIGVARNPIYLWRFLRSYRSRTNNPQARGRMAHGTFSDPSSSPRTKRYVQ